MDSSSLNRILEERKSWRKNHPFGFTAKPCKNVNDGSLNLLQWDCIIPGKKLTSWENGYYKLKMIFPVNYPQSPPICQFCPPIFHPNVYTNDGSICFSLLGYDWHSTITIKQILIGLQTLLNEPNVKSPANNEAANLYVQNYSEYDKKIKEQAMRMRILN